MPSIWNRFLGRGADAATGPVRESPTDEIRIDGAEAFPIARHIDAHFGLPVVDWVAASTWIEGIADHATQWRAWHACERNWLLRFRDALGPRCHLTESAHAAVVCSLEHQVAQAALQYMERALRRIVHVLDGVAQVQEGSREVLILFESTQTYYEYVSHYYPDSGEFALSGGMYLRAGHGHFVTAGEDLALLEPVIAHELTHACVSHLPLPLWLNEGLAVNTEWRLAGRGQRNETPHEIHARQLAFWNEELIQDFWSGESFNRTDEGTMLSYDLAQTIVAQLSREWDAFRAFATTAQADDGGDAAARETLGLDLGTLACALLEHEASAPWSPYPSRWKSRSTTPQ